MGIGDRDYMKRPSSDDGARRSSSLDSKAEDALRGVLRRHPNLFKYAGLGIGALVVIGIVAAEIISR